MAGAGTMKCREKSLNLSHFNEDPTTADLNFSNNVSLIKNYHSSLMNPAFFDEENIEDLHYYLVLFNKKKNNVLFKIEKRLDDEVNKTEDMRGKHREKDRMVMLLDSEIELEEDDEPGF